MNIPPGVTVFCDPTLAPAMRALDGMAGLPVSPLSAPASLMLAQLARHTRDDVLFTLSAAMDIAVAKKLVKPETRIDGYSNILVLAGLADRASPPPDKAGLLAFAASARLAVTDPTAASGLDGRGVLTNNGIVAGKIQGAATTADVAFLVTTGAADIGLMYLTDVNADPRLTVIATLQADGALTQYSGAVNAKAVSPNAAAFLAMLRTPPAARLLQAAGISVPEPA